MWLFLVLVAVPIIEIALFIEVGGWIGLWPTLAIVVLTAVAGTYLLRQQGLAALAELRRRAEQGGDVGPLILDGLAILIAGVVLLTPGFFTDAVGFALLIPPVRSALIRWLGKRIVVAATAAAEKRHGPARPRRAETIDGEWEDVTPGDPQPVRDASLEPSETGKPSGWTRNP